MRKIVAVISLVVIGALAGGLALADDESDRKDLIEDIDEKVEDVGDELSGFESDSDAGDLDDAVSYAREVKDLVSKLERVKGSDSRAGNIVSYYPGYVEQFREAARYLKKMKEVQRTADGVADRCTSDESTLQSTIRTLVGRPTEAGDFETKLGEMGRSFGSTWKPKMEKLKEGEAEMQRSVSYARFSVSDNKWSNVSSYFGNASSGIQSYWKERYQAAETACKRLALGEAHPDLEKAVKDLREYKGATKGTVTQLKQDYNKWLREEVRPLRKFSDDDRDAIRTVFCTAGEYEMEAKAKEVADRWASQISSAYGTVRGQADRLKARAEADALAKYKGPKDVLAGIEKNLANLEKLKNHELLGSNNPSIRARIEWGNKRHEDLQRGCHVAELEISSSDCTNGVRPGSGCRLDCVKVSGSMCKIIEFKPDSEGAKNEGAVQLKSYKDGLAKWYQRDKAELFKKYDAVKSCENNDKTGLNLDTDLTTYELCSSTVRNQLGLELNEATLEVAESGE